MQTAFGLRGQLLLFVLPLFLITACGQKPEAKGPDVSPQRSAAEHLRAMRSVTPETPPLAEAAPAPIVEPTSQPTSSIPATEPANTEPKPTASQSLAERLRTIVGDSFASSKELKERAERGEADAQHQLGQRYFESGDYAEALKWYQLSASQGNAKAQKSLGVLYVTGQGVTRDLQEAVKWYKMAADQGDAEAQYSLGLRYVNGEAVGQNFAEAAKWFALAAEQGVTDAQLSLARRYAAGEGVAQDLTEAYKWCLVTEKYGTYQAHGARQLRSQLEETMSAEQIALAKNRADAFKPKTQ
ncbi:MAG: tetratricopeptide repeat protein [Limisphaerales bacterium]